jgi:methyl-accepting chemotaxis protein
MATLRTMRIGNRLAIGFVVGIAAAAVIGAVGVSSLRHAAAEGDRVFHEDGKALAAVERMTASVQETSHDVAQHLYVYDGDLATQDQLVEEVAEDLVAEDALVAQAKRDIPAELAPQLDAYLAARAKVATLRERAFKQSRLETVEAVDERADSRVTYIEQFLPAIDEFHARTGELVEAVEAHGTEAIADVEANTRRSTMIIVLTTLFAALASALLGWRITRSITRPVARMRTAADQLALGDARAAGAVVATDADDSARDEIADTERSVASLVEYLRDASELAERLAVGDTSVEVVPRSDADLLSTAMAGMRDGTSQMADVAARIAAGETGVEAPVRSDRDTLGHAFRQMVQDLESREARRIIEARRDEQRAESDRQLLEELAAMSQQLSAASATSERTAGEVTGGMEEVAGAIAELAANAQRQVEVLGSAASAADSAAEAARSTTGVVATGVESVDGATEAMATLNESAEHVGAAINELSSKSERVGGIVETITSIAEQTNLLALNAAIEAARAGEQGRGFAVVADEVRKLAEESQGSAAEISAIVAEIRAETDRTVEAVRGSLEHAGEGTRRVGQAREAFLEIEQSVRAVLERTDEIRGSAQHAVSLAQTASSHTEQVSAATEETAASMQEVSATSSELSRLAESLAQTATASGDPARGLDPDAGTATGEGDLVQLRDAA